jgi:hypothetical protein
MYRIRRFSLRALLILVTLVAIVFGYIGSQRYIVSRQASAIKQIEALGGVPLPINLRDGIAYNLSPSNTLPEPQHKRWMYWVFGTDYFTYVPLIKVHQTTSADSIRAMVPYIKQLRLMEGLNVAGKSIIVLDAGANPNVDSQLKQFLQEQVPQCMIVAPDPTKKQGYSL